MLIRVMHVVDSLESGGLENGVVNLVQKMDPERFEHVVCAVRNLGASAVRLPTDRVELVCLHKTTSGFSLQMGTLARVVNRVQPHILHSRNWGAIEAIIAGRLAGSCALVHSEHGVETVGQQAEPIRRNWFRRIAFSLADRVFAVSRQLRDFRAQQTRFPVDRIAVIHNGVDAQRFRPSPEARSLARSRFGLQHNHYCIGIVGRLEPVKDVWTLLHAATKLPHSVRPWRILIAGDGTERAVLERFVNNCSQLRNQVQFLGELSDVPALLNALDVYVLPSLFEGISNSLLEAMANGLPVVASNTGGNPEVVIDRQSGMLFPVGDSARLAICLEALRHDRELRTMLGHHSLHRVKEHFSLDSMAGHYDSLYSGLVRPRQAVAQSLRSRIRGLHNQEL